MPDPITNGGRNACFGPPADTDSGDSDLVCKAPEVSCKTSPAVSAPPAAQAEAPPGDEQDTAFDRSTTYNPLKMAAMVEADPDYTTRSLSISVLPMVNVGISATTDRFGNTYIGVSAEVGKSEGLLPVTFAVNDGKLLYDGKGNPAGAPTERQLKDFLCGDSVNAHAEVGIGEGVVNSSGGTAAEVVFATDVGIGAGFAHNFGRCP